jgi:tetratricopeptide (TPR) repeat protein
MRTVLTLGLLLSASMLAEAAAPPAPCRALTAREQKEVGELQTQIGRHAAAGEFEAAARLARQVAEYRRQRQGARHWQAIDARLTMEHWQRLTKVPAAARAAVVGARRVNAEAGQLYVRGQYRKAEAKYREALAICEKALGPKHPHTAASYNNLAVCLHSLGQAAAALPLYQKALDIRAKALGPEHLDTAFSCNSVASCLESLGQAGKALPLYKKALDIREKAQGPEHPGTATSYNNVASCLQSLGQAGKALPLYQKALDIREKTLGPEHLDTAFSCNNVAYCLRSLGQASKALPLYQKALHICEKVQGPEHPDTARSYNNVAVCLESLGQAGKALPLFQKALDIWEKALGAEHPLTATSYNNVAFCLESLGQAGKALPLYQKALDISEKALGPEHPDTAASYSNLASCLRSLGQAGKALPLHQKALDIHERVLGPEHPDTAINYNNLAYCRQLLGQAGKALPLFQKALDIREKVLGPEHPGTARSYNNVADCLKSLGQASKALPRYQKALHIHEKALGPEHPHTATSYNNLASCLQLLGQAGKALPLHQKALTIREKMLGHEHPHTASSYNNMASCLWQVGRMSEALRLLQASLPAQEAARFHLATSGFDRSIATSDQDSPHALLALGLARLGQPGNAFRHADAALARGLLDDLAENPAHSARLLSLAAALRSVEARLLPLLGRAALSAEQKSQRDELSRQQRRLSSELAQLAAAASARQVLPLADIQRQLPADAALVLWLDMGRPNEHWACVLRREGPPRWLRLPGSGKGDTWTAQDSTLPVRAYDALTDPAGDPAQRRRLLEALHKQRLAPLEPHLQGVRRLFVVPVGVMARVPVETLAERYAISYVPSGSVLARTLARHRPLRGSSLLVVADPTYKRRETPLPEAPPRGLLVLSVLPRSTAARAGIHAGDVLLDYAGKPLVKPADLQVSKGDSPVPIRLWREGKTAPLRLPPGSPGVVVDPRPIEDALAAWRGERRRLLAARRGGSWAPLPGTRLEAGLLTRLVPAATLLRGEQASEQDLEKLAAADELKGYRLLHIAAHGEDNDLRPLETALILAQDRLPANSDDEVAAVRRRTKALDGRLTVGTVLATWKLDADLVVLSACSSGLGRQTQGEGMLGFAQALLQKGARSVLLSSWKVDDAATALLMARFYENLLGKRAGLKAPLGRAEALREAGVWLRGLSREEALRRLGVLSEGVPRGSLKYLPTVPGRTKEKAERPFAHPYYWAAFVLLGDPD